MIRVTNSVVIRRPLEEVFAYGTDFSHLPEWNNMILDVKDYEGPPTVGTRYTQVSKFLGRTMEAKVVITAFEPDKMFASDSEAGPVTSTTTVTFTPVPEGTQITEVLEGETGGVFRLAEPIVKQAIGRQRANELANLKDVLEHGPTLDGNA